MGTLGTVLTLSDWAKHLDPDGSIAMIVEILNETNEILDDMLWIEGNLPIGHRHTVRGGLPTPAWRLLNYGVPITKGQTVQVDDACGMLEDYGQVDKDLAMLNGNTEAFRLSQDRAHIEGMSQAMASALFYGNQAVDPEKITGLAPRFNDLSAENADNIVAGDGTGSDNTSVWLVVWGEDKCTGIFPKGSMAGLQSTDLGEERVSDSNTPTGYYQALVNHYQWKAGLAMSDWRYVVRIPNIDVSNLTKNAASGSDLIDLMTQALELPPSLSAGRPVFYCNRTIRSFLRRQIRNANNVNITMEQVAGNRVVAFDEVPVRRCDAILNTEALVS